MEDNGPILVATLGEVGKIIADLQAMEKDRDRWRRALTACTPGGSEFADDPIYCQNYVAARVHTLWESNKKFVIDNRKLREGLENSKRALRLVRDGAEGQVIRTLARDVLQQLEEANVGKHPAPAVPGPEAAPNDIARQERT